MYIYVHVYAYEFRLNFNIVIERGRICVYIPRSIFFGPISNKCAGLFWFKLMYSLTIACTMANIIYNLKAAIYILQP